ncbi:sortilin-related receptor [Anopheles gambiae]|uniref:sortilin-related receptor n=1 Tax=Anopheles gambiae TaxID=7165 RepID=UPI002AC90EE9|nr:sortilin-related receptor [Anopheles gambiae]XP_061509017.1 sortilin-related receptor [Anopheles gambiae]XP_061509018.1 sortilin-related receptor [Anopheles gambiae]XP_061509019.1 sortilin-related receptor [Anopheles gambiae]XP_061509020.1 sortilin-related receptor [Anopheles gambiae]XP_061509021.1 sortilin-related receptor [Anopheles gambiae]XP_061509022.1 sortilin-related receptor [Anopheles gambiae]XP_061509023.1 sortilin-related receptor [Anopheles gambiae]XP_061509024.1 sortilin-rel
MARPVVAAAAAVVVWRRLTVLLTVLCLYGLVVPTEQQSSVRHGFPPSVLHVEPDVEASRRLPRTVTLSVADLDGEDGGVNPEVAALLGRSPFLRDELARRAKRDAPPPTKDAAALNKTIPAAAEAAAGAAAPPPAAAGSNSSTPTKNTVASEFSPSPIIKAKTTNLNDSHGQLIVHWLGEGTDVMICLAREPPDTDMKSPPPSPSRIFMSEDYGDTFLDKTADFMLNISGVMTNSTVEQFFTHQKYNTIVFIDPRNQAIFTSEDYGKTITMRKLDFTPSDVSFYDSDRRTFLVLDKRDPQRKLYYTTDFGASFTLLQSYVKSFLWSSGDGVPIHLYVERKEPTNTSSVIFFNAADLYTGNRQFNVLVEKVEDFHINKDFMFASQRLPNSTQLLISYKRGKFVKADFQTELDIRGYHVADVEGRRIMISVVHTERISHLYVSESNEDMTDIKFVLSLENIFTYVPELNWRTSWLVKSSETAFTDLYRVEGLRGIYIASKMNRIPVSETITPDYLMSVITFDHGNTWRPIKAPETDDEGALLNCGKDCSLHLSQKFCSLYPVARSVTIMSSKTAPGVIMAAGVVGKSLKGHPGVYISRDAGLTWKQILKNYYFFNMGDHGGILVAVKYFKLKGETNEILYSTDEGERWHSTPFIGNQLKVYGLMREAEANGTIFTLFGSEQEEHRWLIIKIDLKNAFTANCTEDDYKFWTPGSYSGDYFMPCVLGRQDTYQRRKPHANCHNGIGYERPIRQEVCECNSWDFECDYGFVRSGQKRSFCVRNKTLTSFDPYAVPASCKPGAFYKRTRGYRKIEGDVCVDGFSSQFLPQSIPCPMEQSNEFLIIAQREKIARIDLRNNNTRTEFAIPGLKNVIAIEFDQKRNCVFWADILTDVIGRQCLNGNSTPETLVDNGLSSVEGMSYDWISEVLYFVDGMRLMIEALRVPPPGTIPPPGSLRTPNVRHTIIDSKYLNKPRGIVVHPMEGYLFWTDWNSIRPSISRSNMDGSDVRELFTKPQVAWPNGVTIDYMAERLYWVDASKDYIASSDLDGKNFHKVMQQDPFVQHPFAVAVLKDVMYWDDWKQNSVFSADKDHGIMAKLVAENMTNLMDMKVYGHTIQVGTNACSNNERCSHICVGGPKRTYSCLCPDGMELVKERCTCPAGTTAQANGCARTGKTCGPKFFNCNNTRCVPQMYKCDGEDDCGDRSDEEGCPAAKPACPPHMFTCKLDQQCIPKHYLCDFDRDCKDGSDEENCKTPNCKTNEFTCDNGRCIKLGWMCDGEDDCRDGSDEKDCQKKNATLVECKADEFRCNVTNACLPNQWRCDTEKDCPDGSDEANCNNNTCESWMFTCVSDGKCIYKTWQCDGAADCKDGSDEKDCPMLTGGGGSIDAGKTEAPTKKPGINIKPGQECHDWMFKCNNDRCVPYWWKCDGVNDCEDHSDEQGCGEQGPAGGKPIGGNGTTMAPTGSSSSSTPPRRKDRTCGLHEFRCDSGSCIPKRFVCDSYSDCPRGEDEENCPSHKLCSNNNFRCRTDGMCLPMDRFCNGISDCVDGSDEECNFKPSTSVTTNRNCSTNPGVFACDNTCFALMLQCDGKPDCYDGSDEENCSGNRKGRHYQVTQISVDQRSLNSTSFLIFWWLPATVSLEYLPSIFYNNEWKNVSNWITETEYRFTNLKPYTTYTVTTYVRAKGQTKITPPYIYYEIATTEGIPSPPLSVSVIQQNGSRVLVSWEPPKEANGKLEGYTINYRPQSKNVTPAQNVKVSASETSVIIDKDFKPHEVYEFWVKARNGKHESLSSVMVPLTFDGTSFVEKVTRIEVLNKTAKSVTLRWKPVTNADGYMVVPILPQTYPVLPTIKVQNATVITLDNMVPGTQYVIKVAAYVKNFFGQHETTIVSFGGVPLPALNVELKEKTDQYALLQWDEPKGLDTSKLVYGVYYGTSMDALFEAARINTTARSIKLAGLMPCQSYLVSVGIVGPIGPGPLGRNPLKLETAYNRTLPPKELTVDINETSQEMTIEWQHSCALDLTAYPAYIITVRELTLNKTSVVTVQPSSNKTMVHVFRQIPKGAAYEISVSTDIPNAQAVRMVAYSAPLPAPDQLQVWPERNGTYVVFWKAVKDFKDDGFTYEIIVHEGHGINSSVPPFLTIPAKEPPAFIQPDQLKSIADHGVFTVGVRLKTDQGLYSDIVETESFTKYSAWIMMEPSTATVSSAWKWIVPTVVAVVLVAVLVYFVQRHRRLQSSFSRFANSHYDTRTGATRIGCTLDDDEHEHQEVPRSFSDDEPLVIA